MPTLTNAGANAYLDSAATYYVKLHIGDPTDAGTAAPSVGFPTRIAAGLGAAAGRARTNTANVDWPTPTATAETITHVSVWTAATAGACHWRGPLVTAKAVAVGEKFRILAGDLDLTID